MDRHTYEHTHTPIILCYAGNFRQEYVTIIHVQLILFQSFFLQLKVKYFH